MEAQAQEQAIHLKDKNPKFKNNSLKKREGLPLQLKLLRFWLSLPCAAGLSYLSGLVLFPFRVIFRVPMLFSSYLYSPLPRACLTFMQVSPPEFCLSLVVPYFLAFPEIFCFF